MICYHPASLQSTVQRMVPALYCTYAWLAGHVTVYSRMCHAKREGGKTIQRSLNKHTQVANIANATFHTGLTVLTRMCHVCFAFNDVYFL